MFRLIYRQRRRLLFGTFFLMMTVAAQEWGQIDELFVDMVTASGQFITWLALGLTILLVSVIVFSGLALFVLVFRRARMMVEMITFWGFLNVTLKPAERLSEQFHLSDVFTALITLAFLLTFVSIVYGTVLDGFRFGLDWKSKRRVRVRRPIEEVWPAFALAECGPESNWEQILHDAQPVPDEPDSFDISYLMGPSTFQQQRHTVMECEAPNHYRYRFSGNISIKNRRLTDGEFDVTLEPDGKGVTFVTASQHNKAMLPRMALALWFDDQLGDALDGFAARARGKMDWSMTGLEHRKTLSLT
ncbi:hypothetical protein [Ruegeria arenilitoris]|uniref:hypothetical protein n=1 Tax=Ruegeria arenilitoris TaxID=1173585 RepID=UPI00147DE938|nr:hypothetical protein [Ruegeria arenilitoris]